jgi:hypothetical protein
MRLRVLDDDRPGYAQLAFDSPLSQPTLAVSVRSLREGAYLGPDGKWQRSAHFFPASRISGDARSTLYRVGPQIVNFLPDLESVEFAAADGSFRLETTWENATPQLAGDKKGRSIYQEQAQRPQTPQLRKRADAPVAPPEPPVPPPPPRPEPPVPPPEPPPSPVRMPQAALLGVPPPHEDNGGKAEEAVAVPRQDDGGRGGQRGFFARRRGLLFAIAAIGLAVLGFGLYLIVPCGLPGKTSCPLQGEQEAAEKARQCVASRSAEGRECEVATECFDPYVADFPNGPARPDLEDKAKAAGEICQQMEERGRGVFQCVEDLKAQHRSPCDFQAACFQGFLALYHKGSRWSEVDRASQQAKADCDNAPPVGEDEALLTARQCARDDARKCDLPGCYAAYLNTFGLNGIHRDAAQREAVELDKKCIDLIERAGDDDAAFAAARECRRGAEHCARPRCYESYLSQFGADGKHREDAKAEAAQLDEECLASVRQTEEQNLWDGAKSCASTAQPCDVKSCYRAYLGRYGDRGKYSAVARRDIERAEEACRQPEKPAVVDGLYSARSQAACGARQGSITVLVAGHKISWEHEFQNVRYKWEGTIDSSGNVSATVANVPGHAASGVFTGAGMKEIQMKYPQCTMTFEIRGKIQ